MQRDVEWSNIIEDTSMPDNDDVTINQANFESWSLWFTLTDTVT